MLLPEVSGDILGAILGGAEPGVAGVVVRKSARLSILVLSLDTTLLSSSNLLLTVLMVSLSFSLLSVSLAGHEYCGTWLRTPQLW